MQAAFPRILSMNRALASSVGRCVGAACNHPIKSPFSGPRCVLALAGIRKLVVQSKAIENDDLLPLWWILSINRALARSVGRCVGATCVTKSQHTLILLPKVNTLLEGHIPIVPSNRLFRAFDVYWHAPASGDLRHKSRQLKRTICSPAEDGWYSSFLLVTDFAFCFQASHPHGEVRPFQPKSTCCTQLN